MSAARRGRQPQTIGFVDLVGTRDYAKSDPDRFDRAMTSFKESVEEASSLLPSGDAVYLFSDCAYFQCKMAVDAAVFAARVRTLLLLQGFYLKGALGPGELGAAPAGRAADAKRGTTSLVEGHTFRGKIVDVYALQDALKGIGIRLHDDVAATIGRDGHCVNSCYLPDPKAPTAQCFTDLKLSISELDDETLRTILTDFYISSMRRPSLGRYYVTLLITWTRSCHFPRARDDSTAALGIRTVEQLLDPRFEKQVARLPGSFLLYFSLFDTLHEAYGISTAGARIIDRIQSHIAGRKWLLSRLEMVPSCILSTASRGSLLTYLGKAVKEMSQLRAEDRLH